jgi:transcriptional regulator with XRE-family HTH domain
MKLADRFGQNLARHRRAAGLSQEALGERADLHRTAVGQLERGLRVGRIDTLLKLCAVLEISPEALTEGIAWVPRRTEPGRFEFSSEGAIGQDGR